MTQDSGEVQAARFAEIVRHAQRVLGGSGGRASQRDLAVNLGIAPTMTGRYLAGNVDFRNLRAITIEKLAAATQLEPGALFAWIRDGREAAMDYQQLMCQEPVAFAAVDLARKLVTLLEEDPEPGYKSGLPQSEPDYGALQQDIQDQRDVAPALFDRLVAMASAEETLEKVAVPSPLDESDWLKLQQLLDLPAQQLQQRYGFARAVSRTQPPIA